MSEPASLAGIGGAFAAPDWSFHHLGIACRDLEAEQAGLRPLGYVAAGPAFVDTAQGVTGLFVEGAGPRLELLAPLAGRAVLDPWLRGGSPIYHLAYEVPDLDDALAFADAADARRVTAPAPAPAFGGRRICFVMLRVRLLVELIERPPAAG